MLKKRLNNKKGFTLAELLIAVAIIGILVAISVPVFTSKLSDARVATDQANIRAAKAAAVAKYFENEQGGTFYYDADKGTLESSDTSIKGYGKENKDKVIKVIIDDKGTVTVTWEAKSSGGQQNTQPPTKEDE